MTGKCPHLTDIYKGRFEAVHESSTTIITEDLCGYHGDSVIGSIHIIFATHFPVTGVRYSNAFSMSFHTQFHSQPS